MRIINIHAVFPARFRLMKDTVPVTWRPVSKDGAKLPPARTIPRAASQAMGVGETYDFEWTPKEQGEFNFRVTSIGRDPIDITQRVTVRKKR